MEGGGPRPAAVFRIKGMRLRAGRGPARSKLELSKELAGIMPIYEYECAECGARFEKLQKFGEQPPETCPNGHRQVHRLFSQPAIIFKGSGFYVTDNGRKVRNGASAPASKKKEKPEPASSSETPSSETK